MAKVLDEALESYLSSARDTSNGTMPMNVVVEDHQVDKAKAWLKSKRKVKTLTILSRSEHDALQEKRNAQNKKRCKKVKQE